VATKCRKLLRNLSKLAEPGHNFREAQNILTGMATARLRLLLSVVRTMARDARSLSLSSKHYLVHVAISGPPRVDAK